jgi:FMN-dependent NADH-azoreductase
MNILHIDCSPRPHSHCRQLSAVIVGRLLSALLGATVTRRDLGREPIPHAASDYAAMLPARAPWPPAFQEMQCAYPRN